jgi:hypothetical protein
MEASLSLRLHGPRTIILGVTLGGVNNNDAPGKAKRIAGSSTWAKVGNSEVGTWPPVDPVLDAISCPLSEKSLALIGNASRKNRFEYRATRAIEKGRGGIYLRLTPEQYAKLSVALHYKLKSLVACFQQFIAF